ncbi:UNVERIFIED_CONTAM: hypothetical protein FKN15_072220 [Acipenser sinensis]
MENEYSQNIYQNIEGQGEVLYESIDDIAETQSQNQYENNLVIEDNSPAARKAASSSEQIYDEVALEVLDSTSRDEGDQGDPDEYDGVSSPTAVVEDNAMGGLLMAYRLPSNGTTAIEEISDQETTGDNNNIEENNNSEQDQMVISLFVKVTNF